MRAFPPARWKIPNRDSDNHTNHAAIRQAICNVHMANIMGHENELWEPAWTEGAITVPLGMKEKQHETKE